jgi:hypothetical protein
MIVDPVPTNPRSPVRRALRLVGLAAPLVLLVAVVAAGALGPPRAEVTPAPSATAEVAAATVRPPALVLNGREIDFPETWVGFRVYTVEEIADLRARGKADGIVVVSGYLSYGSLPWSCTDAYLDADRTRCEGRAFLTDTRVLPATGGDQGLGGTGGAAIGPHLHPVFPPATRGPTPDDKPGSPRNEPIPVLLLGEFPAAGSCVDGRDCDETLIVERVVWVAGAPWAPILTVDPAMDVEPDIPEVRKTVAAAEASLGRGALSLATSVLRPGLLPIVDPAAAAALPPIPEAHLLRPVTYARALLFQFDSSQPLYGRNPAIGWVILDSLTDTVLARSGPPSEPIGTPDASTSASPTP